MGVIKGDTRSLDYSSYLRPSQTSPEGGTQGTLTWRVAFWDFYNFSGFVGIYKVRVSQK